MCTTSKPYSHNLIHKQSTMMKMNTSTMTVAMGFRRYSLMQGPGICVCMACMEGEDAGRLREGGRGRCATPHLCVHQILVFTLTQQQGAIATTTFTCCSSSLSISTAQRQNSCGIHSGSRPSAMHPPSIVLSAWPYAIRHETAPFHRYLTSLGSRSWQL